MKRFILTFVALSLTVFMAVGFALPARAQLSAVSLKFDKDSSNFSFTAGTATTVYLIATNTSSSPVSFYGIDVVFSYNPQALSVAMDKNFIPAVEEGGEWTWSPDTGPAGSEIAVIGTTDTRLTLAAGGSAQIAKFFFTAAADSQITLDKATARVIQTQTDDNIFDGDNSPSSQSFNIGVLAAATPTPYIPYPGALGTTGPVENMFLALGGALVMVMFGYGILRARKNKINQKQDNEFVEKLFK